MKRHRRWPTLAAWAVALGLSAGACGSDDFTPLGGRLPIDVSQDSLAVADSLVGALQELRVVPTEAQALVYRELLYLGSFGPLGLRATPLLRFNFSSYPDTLFDYPWLRVTLQMKMLIKDQGHGARTLALYALADTLDAAMATQPLSGVLADSLDLQVGIPGSASFSVPLDSALVASWVLARRHTGIALVDRTTLPDTNMVGLAARQMQRFSLLEVGAEETAIPEVVIELPLPSPDNFVAFNIIEDVTHFARPTLTSEVEVASHQPARAWFSFDFSGIDEASTINSAILALPIDTLRTIGTGVATMAAYRCTAAEATAASLGSLEEVLRSGRTHDLVKNHTLTLDVTEFVQRKVNGILRPDDGLLVALDSEQFSFDLLTFHNSDNPDPALRPRIRLRVTPPADYEE